MPTLLSDSVNLRTIPDLAAEADRVTLTPASYANWAAMLAAHPTKLDYLLSPGDYRSWGVLTLSGVGGTLERPKTIRYSGADEDTHPVLRATEARVDAIKWQSTANYWHIQGLTQRGPTADTTVTSSSYITMDFCLIEDSERAYGMRVFGGSNNCCMQRCVVRNAIFPPGTDTVCIQFFPSNGVAITGGLVLDNEFYNYGDGVGCSQNVANEFVNVDVLIEGNDFYITEDLYLPDGLADAENAIDIKTGNDSVQTVIRNNRMWGFRANGVSATGDALVFHRAARNILVTNNIIGDCVRGIHESVWIAYPTGPLDQQTPRNIVVTNNQFYDCHQFNELEDSDGAGAAIRPISNMTVNNNYFARCDYVVYVHQTPIAGGPTFVGNTRIDTETLHPDSFSNPYAEALNFVVTPTGFYDTYERKRWTGREFADGAFRGSVFSHRGKTSDQSGATGNQSHRQKPPL